MIRIFKNLFGKKPTADSADTPTSKESLSPELLPESQYVVTVTEEGVSVRRPDGEVESVTWQDLRGVLLETTDQGPFVPDVFWVLVGTESGCVIPQGAIGESELLKRLQNLPGFDNEQVIQASCSADNAKFLCWKYQDEG